MKSKFMSADDVLDKKGYLKIIFQKCPWGHSRLGCPIKPYVKLHPDTLDELAARNILQTHLLCEKEHGEA